MYRQNKNNLHIFLVSISFLIVAAPCGGELNYICLMLIVVWRIYLFASLYGVLASLVFCRVALFCLFVSLASLLPAPAHVCPHHSLRSGASGLPLTVVRNGTTLQSSTPVCTSCARFCLCVCCFSSLGKPWLLLTPLSPTWNDDFGPRPEVEPPVLRPLCSHTIPKIYSLPSTIL